MKRVLIAEFNYAIASNSQKIWFHFMKAGRVTAARAGKYEALAISHYVFRKRGKKVEDES